MRLLYKIFTAAYVLLPIAVVSYWTYKNGSTYLLFGILFSYLGSLCVLTSYDILVVLAAIGGLYLWFTGSFSVHDLTTFYFLCLAGGYVLAKTASIFGRLSAPRSDLDD
jgi:hypothetical protein